MTTDYIPIPTYAIYITGILFVVLILIVLYLVYLLAYKRCRNDNLYRLKISLRDEQPTRSKTSSFHLPKIQFTNRFAKLHSSSEESVLNKNTLKHEQLATDYNENQATVENQSDQTKSYIQRVKEKVPKPVMPPETMAEICAEIVNASRKVDFSKLQSFEKGIEIRNKVIYNVERKSRKSFANSQNKSSSVPDLGIYDVVTTVRPIEKNRSSDSVDYAECQDKMKILKITSDRHSEYYKFPLMLKTSYTNATIRDD